MHYKLCSRSDKNKLEDEETSLLKLDFLYLNWNARVKRNVCSGYKCDYKQTTREMSKTKPIFLPLYFLLRRNIWFCNFKAYFSLQILRETCSILVDCSGDRGLLCFSSQIPTTDCILFTVQLIQIWHQALKLSDSRENGKVLCKAPVWQLACYGPWCLDM